MPRPVRRVEGTSRWSLWSQDSFLSIGSRGSALSIFSVGSFASIGSIGAAGSIGSIGSTLSPGSVLSNMSRGSVLSHHASSSTLGQPMAPSAGVLISILVAGVAAAVVWSAVVTPGRPTGGAPFRRWLRPHMRVHLRT